MYWKLLSDKPEHIPVGVEEVMFAQEKSSRNGFFQMNKKAYVYGGIHPGNGGLVIIAYPITMIHEESDLASGEGA